MKRFLMILCVMLLLVDFIFAERDGFLDRTRKQQEKMFYTPVINYSMINYNVPTYDFRRSSIPRYERSYWFENYMCNNYLPRRSKMFSATMAADIHLSVAEMERMMVIDSRENTEYKRLTQVGDDRVMVVRDRDKFLLSSIDEFYYAGRKYKIMNMPGDFSLNRTDFAILLMKEPIAFRPTGEVQDGFVCVDLLLFER